MPAFGPPALLTEDDLLDVLRRNFEEHWIGGLLESPDGLALFRGLAAVMLRLQDAVDENLYRSAFLLTAPGRTRATSTVRLTRPSGGAVSFTTDRRFLDHRNAVWRPTGTFDVAASGGVQTVDVPVTSERAGHWLNTFTPPTFRALSALPDPTFIIIAGIDPAAGGRTPMLEEHGQERAAPRGEAEAEDQHRARLLEIEDMVTPVAIAFAAIEVMDAHVATRGFAELAHRFGFRPITETFRDFVQHQARGLRGERVFFADDAAADDPAIYSRDVSEALAWFDVEIPYPVDPDDARLFWDDGFFDDPEFGYADIPPSAIIALPVAALVDELSRRRPSCVRFRVLAAEPIHLTRVPGEDLDQAGDWMDQDGAVTAPEISAALATYDGDDSFVVSSLGRGNAAALTVGDLVLDFPAVPTFAAVERVELWARVRRRDDGIGTDPAFAFVIGPTTGATERALVAGAPLTIDHDDWRTVEAILDENPVTAAAWVVGDLAGIVQAGIANVAAAGATDGLLVSSLTLTLVLSYG